MGVPAVASENGRRPTGILTSQERMLRTWWSKLGYVTEHYLEIKCGLPPETRDDNIAKMAEWLLQNHRAVI
ncbi:MAG: hypothetical protein DMG76_05875 [Acidobacteria bacterium]|nr:MAG: hypothetical protein DMG76_05875 [Acidobacteriota bacterium]